MFLIMYFPFMMIMISLFGLLLSLTNGYTKLKCLISFHKNRHRLLDWYTDLLSSSFSQTIVVHRLGAPRTVITANQANIEFVLKTNFHNFPKGKPFTDILGDLLGLGIFNVDGELWLCQRKLASHEFTTRTLREFVVMALEHETKGKLLPLLEEACERETVLDLQEVLRRFAFDVVCKVSLGIDSCRFDLSNLVNAFDRAAEISAKRGTAPISLAWKVKRALGLGSEKVLKEEIELIHNSVAEIIKNKRKALDHDHDDHDGKVMVSSSPSCGGDLLTRLLMAGYGEEVVRDMVISFIMAGRDTTSAAMTWLFWLLSENPGVENDVVEELKTVTKNNDNENDENGSNEFNYEALQGMSFVKACLCEAMRLYPPVPWDSKHAKNDDVLPDGTAVGIGDRVTYFPYGMGRMEGGWGKDCLEFRPDRWLCEPDKDCGIGRVLKPVSPFKFPVFQAGPRVCLGKEMAFTQMKYVVASVLSRFEIRPVSLDRPVFVPLLTAHMGGGFKVLVRRRCG